MVADRHARPSPEVTSPRRCRAGTSLMAAAALGALQACSMVASGAAGVYALPTRRGHAPVGGTVSGQVAAGVVPFAFGADATLRGTADYAHAAIGANLGLYAAGRRMGLFGRVGYAPIGVSRRDGAFWYSMDTSLEVGLTFSLDSSERNELYVVARRSSRSWTLGLRGDVEYRPGQAQADVFVSLIVGILNVEVAGPRGL